jgi:predicted ATPase
MEGARFLKTIRLENILSYGPEGVELSLEPLNVLIGPNASGKSNLIEALSMLRAAPYDIQAPIRGGGGILEWLWKGDREFSTANMQVLVEYPKGQMPLRYRFSFGEQGGRFYLLDEAVENEKPTQGNVQPYFYYRYQNGNSIINVVSGQPERIERRLQREDVNLEHSILQQRRDRYFYPELTFLAEGFLGISIYRDWGLGRSSPSRLPQDPNLPSNVLGEGGWNLVSVIGDLLNLPPTKRDLMEQLRNFYGDIEDVVVNTRMGLGQLYFHEKGLQHPVPATRLSDGTLRFLSLLAILSNPQPPPVICIEEPEIGLHPDIISAVAKLLVEASSRSQIFVTTHSDVLVDALTDTPEAVVVCEKYDGATTLTRLDGEKLKHWLADYRLGEIWVSGELGGNRW